jgi:hypothetical protein
MEHGARRKADRAAHVDGDYLRGRSPRKADDRRLAGRDATAEDERVFGREGNR